MASLESKEPLRRRKGWSLVASGVALVLLGFVLARWGWDAPPQTAPADQLVYLIKQFPTWFGSIGLMLLGLTGVALGFITLTNTAAYQKASNPLVRLLQALLDKYLD